MWVAQATTYVKISSPGIGTAFSEYDGVELQISGLPDTTAYKQIKNLNGSAVLWGKDDGYIVVVGIVDQSVTLGGVDTPDFSMSVDRKMPEMDFVIEHNNRLWGCRYGLNRNQEVVNELYASKLGDFKNWSCFMGISTDSYSVSLGSDGPFTGAVTHGNYPIFFKENCLHKVYGQMPSNFQVQTTSCRGVQKGCADSLAIVNEVLYYKGKNGVCAYDGSIPAEVSSQFGELRYESAIAAAWLTARVGTRRRKTQVSSLLRNTAAEESTSTAKVVVFIPPAVEPGEPPISIRNISVRCAAPLISLRFTVLNPAVLGVTA